MGTTAPCVTVEHDGPIAVVRLDRPPVNALELGIAADATTALDAVLGSDAGAIVVTGAGRCFSAGLDLKVVPTYGPEEQRDMIAAANRLLATLYTCPLPVVTAVNGNAIAGGLVIALTGDYRVGPKAPCLLGLTEARAGIPFPAVAMVIVQSELAPPAARVLTLVARNVDADRALAMGVLDELVPPDQVFARAMAVARDLATMPRDAYARIKRQLRGPAFARIEALAAGQADPMLAGWLGTETASAAARVLGGTAGT